MLRAARIPVLVLLLLAMVATGCAGGGTGGGSGDDTGTGRAATESGDTTATESGETGATAATEAGGTRSVQATTVTDASFESDVLQSGKPVLVHFWAEWCGPCRKLAPQLEEIAGEHEANLTLARLNVDDNSEVTSRFDIKSIPTLVLFVDGVEKKRLTGTLSKQDIDSQLAEFVS